MPYATIEEAIEIANGTRYGLGASVFGPDQRQAIQVAKRLECGMVSVNDFGVFYVSPFNYHLYISYAELWTDQVCILNIVQILKINKVFSF